MTCAGSVLIGRWVWIRTGVRTRRVSLLHRKSSGINCSRCSELSLLFHTTFSVKAGRIRSKLQQNFKIFVPARQLPVGIDGHGNGLLPPTPTSLLPLWPQSHNKISLNFHSIPIKRFECGNSIIFYIFLVRL